MIKLKRLNDAEVAINPELIEWIDVNPDTTISLATGSKIVVKDSLDEVIEKIMVYRSLLAEKAKSPAEQLLKSYKKVQK